MVKFLEVFQCAGWLQVTSAVGIDKEWALKHYYARVGCEPLGFPVVWERNPRESN